MSSIPARALLHGLRPIEYAGVVGVLLVFFIFDATMWHEGLKRYQSASS